ncbi:histidine phosphatase family protein [Alteromonas sp. ASW11-130]|uniref:histidine phosphatase family protein n=1 Tax=Alteromonas sp. ASW11-130 TaxID=3015775 RepID=UPI002241E44F|nr:histidine phosphatase family protein [Alteromonas sp. ASW11-130]MCW8091511.1 histidine phosphatase family protein [Alteromonas sp. ASW11-130]
MAAIYLIRHGQASFHAEDYDKLSELGIEQAAFVGRAMAYQKVVPDAVYRGSLLRHKETAEHSLPQFGEGLDVHELPQWNEYDHREILARYDERLATPASTKELLGSHPHPMDALKNAIMKAMAKWMSGAHDANYSESWEQFNARVFDGLDVVRKAGHNASVVYTSGGPISLITCKLLGLPLTDLMKINWMLVNGGITKLIVRGKDRKLSLSSLNEHSVFANTADKRFITYT